MEPAGRALMPYGCMSTDVRVSLWWCPLPMRTEIIRTVITVVLAAIIVIVWGSNTMVLDPSADSS